MYSLVNLWELSEHTLFDDIKLPDGIDKEILVNTIFDECAEYEPLTIDVDLMKLKIKNFFLRNYDNFRRLYEYTQLDYNPIENYNRYSDITTTDNTTGSKSDTTTNNRTTTNSTSSTNNRTISNSSEDETKISAYDSSTYQNNQLVNNTSSGTDNTTGSETINGTNNDSGSLESSETRNNTNVVSDHTHGNIGVTTTTQMLEQDTKYWRLNNMYSTIAQKFMFTFTITTI